MSCISQAAVAVQAGVCVDIFAVTNEYTDLASLKFLSIESGGSLFLYANTDDSTLPQDMWVTNPNEVVVLMGFDLSSQLMPWWSTLILSNVDNMHVFSCLDFI